MKIDMKRMRMELLVELPKKRAELGKMRAEGKIGWSQYWSALRDAPAPDVAETLCSSVAAHLRGRLHMKRVHGSTISKLTGKSFQEWLGLSTSNQVAFEAERFKFDWTPVDQGRLIAPLLEKYEVKDE